MEFEKQEGMHFPKIPTKKILIGIGITIGIISVGFHIWNGVADYIKETEEIAENAKIQAVNTSFRRGLIIGANNLAQQIKNGIRINFENGTILFVPKQ